MKPLVSVLIPSINRPKLLLGCVESICRSATHGDFEVIVRLHKSDSESLAIADNLRKREQVRIILGEDLNGYKSLSEFFRECAAPANGVWCWFLNDDMIVEGDWMGEFSKVPIDSRHIIQPEFSRLNLSVYRHYEGGPSHAQPTRIWEKFGEPLIGGAPCTDVFLDELLRKKNGWKTWFLNNVTVRHNWTVTEKELRERA